MNESATPPSHLDLFRRIGWAQRQAGENWVRERDLSQSQAFVLGYLVQNPGTIQRDIARVSRTSAASVSSLLQGLERRGLIDRRTEGADERTKRVFATDAGGELIAGFAEAMHAADDIILAPLSGDEKATLLALLAKIAAELPQPTR